MNVTGYVSKSSTRCLLYSTNVTEAPGPVKNLQYQELSADSVTLTWQAPSFLGGRTDLFYTVLCETCSTNVVYAPSQMGIRSTVVTLTKLVPESEYTVQILSENSASSSAPINRPAAQITFITRKDGTVQQDFPVKVLVSTFSLTL